MAATPSEHLGNKPNGPTWHELLGSKNWEGQLDPLDNDLRQLILRCGDFCQVTYDSFINDPNSAFCGSSRYGKENLLLKTAFPGGYNHYNVVAYLYATAKVDAPEVFFVKSMSRERWDRESNWIGYVAVSNDEWSREIGRREIYVAWRGTTRNYEWIDVLEANLQSAKALLSYPNYENKKDARQHSSSSNDEDDTPKVMAGWLTIYLSDDSKSPFTNLSAREQLMRKLKHLIDKYNGENVSITLTGHSLGATLSIVSAFDVVQNLTNEIPVTTIVFGSPKVGNRVFMDMFNSHHNLKVLHVRNEIDLIPHYPTSLMGYTYLGTELIIDTKKSTYLKDSKNPSDWHNLQAMLHIVNGWHGVEKKFELVIKRSIALVNKSCDYLKEECLVPPSWWVEKNKGMVLDDDGEWVLSGPEDVPISEFE